MSPKASQLNQVFPHRHPDTILTALLPDSRFFTKFFEGTKNLHALGINTFGDITEAIGVERRNHILYTTNYKPQFSPFLAIFNTELWLPTLLFAIIYSFLSVFRTKEQSKLKSRLFLTKKKDSIRKSFLPRFGSFIWFYLGCILTSPEPISPDSRILLMPFWLFASLDLGQYFTDDMLAKLTARPPDTLIDSWDDLAETNLKIVAHLEKTQIEDKEAERKEYFSKLSPFYKQFTERLTLEPIWKYLDIENRLDLFDKLCEKPDFVLMRRDVSLHYDWSNQKNGIYRKRLHVSKFGGDVMPTFFSTTFAASDQKRKIVHFW